MQKRKRRPKNVVASRFPKATLDLIGQKFGRLTIQEIYSVCKNGKYLTVATCLCDCGTIKTIGLPLIKRGDTKSCGCLQKEIQSARMKARNKANPRPKKQESPKKPSIPKKRTKPKSAVQRIMETDENTNTDKENEKLLAELDEIIAQMDKKEQELKDQDPFYYYEPSNGAVTDAGRKVLEEFLKPEDIPEYLESQKNIHASNASIKLAAGGNQGGKSVCGAIEAYIWATGEVPISMRDYYPKEMIPKTFPQHVRVTGVDWGTMLSNVLPAFRKWVPRKYLLKGKWSESYSTEQRTVFLHEKGKLKGTIEFMTNKQDVESFHGPASPRHDL